MKIYSVGPGQTYPTIAAALAVIAGLGQPLTETQQIEVTNGIAPEAVTIPPGIQPTSSFPLNIVNVDFSRPILTSVDLRITPFIRFTGFEIGGNVQAGLNGQMISENIIRGSLLIIGNSTPITLRVYNNSIHEFTGHGILVQNCRGTIRVLFNSILCDKPSSYGLVINNSDIEETHNIIQANGADATTRAIQLVNTTGRTVVSDHNLFWTTGAAIVGDLNLGSGVVVTPTIAAWRSASSQDANTLFTDPMFGCPGDDGDYNLDIAQESPAIAAGTWDADVQVDIDKTRRPQLMGDPAHATTLGAFESAGVITQLGKQRILDLIGGLSKDSITLVAVGDKGTVSDADYLDPVTPSRFAIGLNDQIFVLKIQAPPPFTPRFTVGTTGYFDCFVGPTPAATAVLLDGKINTVSEIGLVTDDGLLFLLRTVQRTPFDPLGRTTVRIRFGVTVGENICDDLVPQLTLTAN